MVNRCVRVFIEGGSGGRTADNDFRRAWKKFLHELHALSRINGFRKLEPVRCKGRRNAYNRFKDAVKEHPDDLAILLVDAEGAVGDQQLGWDVVLHREGDRWTRPSWASESHLYLMVPMVEAWLLTDHAALSQFFNGKIELSGLPSMDLERRSKADIDSALKRATANKSCRTYSHGMGNEIIEFVDPEKVKTLRHGSRLFFEMGKLIEEQH